MRALAWVAAILLVALVGLSRIYLGVHYPSDVLGGYLTSLAWVSFLWRLHRRQLRGPVMPAFP